ncbi:B3 domain-containing protein Os03g0212300-like [Triticum aestivum]|uniref:B3 domain-containing protein Os03g0212300-like n=1 Tax=Triticum aestivum TaxID=4565 RepID=UPI001D01D08F|nr:B3 domain-containing protein Os03g0212300-like [Triticum aestivum]
MAGLEGFDFFEIVIEKSCSRQRLPDKFAKMLAGREPHKVKLREAGSGLHRLCWWEVLVVFDGEGHMYLGPGWEHFARAHELQLGYFLVFRYDGDAMFTVKMFDNTMCRMYYQHDDDASNGSRAGMKTRSGVGMTRSSLFWLMTNMLWWWLTTTLLCWWRMTTLLWWWRTTTLLWWWQTTTTRWWWRTTTSRWWRRLQSHSLATGTCQLW